MANSSDSDDENKWQLFISTINGKTRIVRVRPDSSVDSLFRKVTRLISDGLDVKDLRLMFSAQELAYGQGKKLSDYKIKTDSTIVPMFRLKGGASPKDALKIKKRELTPLPPFISITTTEADMITLDDDPSERRAKMPCGHVIGPESMTSFVHSVFSQGQFTFNCPFCFGPGKYCGVEWPYFLVRHVACLADAEIKDIETKISNNYLNRASGILQCPGCRNWCFREDNSTNCMQCLMCTIKNKAAFHFCWSCQLQWKSEIRDGMTYCGNLDCNGVDRRITFLATCATKNIGEVIAPAMRGCPNCGLVSSIRPPASI